jgi:dTDP-4-amino-4,6-dideoxygalactose transaminase
MSGALLATSPSEEPVPFNRVTITLEARAAADRTLAGGWVTTGPEVHAFEREFAAAVGSAHAVAVSSCTAALELSLRALELPAGARVLTPAMTFAGAVHAIIHAGLVPVLVDVNPDTLMPDPEHVASAASRSGAPQAMVVLHFGGAPAAVEALANAARLPLERVVEDAAHALWTRVGDREVGGISAATCFSFYATKNLPIGEGGMVTTDDPHLADTIHRSRLHGMSADAWRRYLPGGSWRYDVDVAGLKANMTDVSAAIGRVQLRHLPRWQHRREQIARQYSRLLSEVPGIRVREAVVDGRHAWHLYVIQVTAELGVGRDELGSELAAEGIDTSVHFIPVHQLSYFREVLGDHTGVLPGTDIAAARVLSLPIYPAMTDAQVDRVCNAVASVADAGASRRTVARGVVNA